jgi:diguanylate cyclase (GGDEF)-like protein
MSLRVKFIAGLLATSLLSVMLVWAVAHDRVVHKFDDLVLRRSAHNFRNDVAAYWLTYGSWQAGQQVEAFNHFVARRRATLTAGPQSDDAVRALPPWSGPPAASAVEPRPGVPPPPGEFVPPFRFLLLDADGKVLNPVDPRDQPGRMATTAEMDRAVPIEIGHEVVAYASLAGLINYTETDRAYLTAVGEALAWGIAAAAGMAVGLGLLVGNRLSRSLRRLTRAIAGMEHGALRQHVEVGSHDEIGSLARAFNAMSDALAASHEALQASYQKISQQAEELRELAIRDALTQLYNRRHFDGYTPRLYEQSVRYTRPLSVMIGDIDFFKKINDRFSHATGDAVLREVGKLLREHTRASDVVARYGGEEFVIAFPETELTVAAEFCERLRQRIEAHPWQRIHPELAVTMSMGLSGDLSLGSVENMLKAADELLYQAKSTGRNRVCHQAEERAA